MNRLFVIWSISVALPGSASAQPFPPGGFEMVDITRDRNVLHGPRGLNNCGQAVYHARFTSSWARSDVFLYDNGYITRITENPDRDVNPGITENGIIHWGRGHGDDGTTQFLMLMNGAEVVLVESPLGFGGLGTMNSLKQYAWSEDLGSGCREADQAMYFFDGERTRQLTYGGNSVQDPKINDRGSIVWTQFDFCEEGNPSSLVYYKDNAFRRIGVGSRWDTLPSINDLDQVAYATYIPEREWWSIWMWENGETWELIPGPTTGPRINNLGDIAFGYYVPEGEYHQVWVYDADTARISRWTNDPFHQGVWAINDYGEILIASVEFGSNWQVRMIRRVRTGDSEFDGDIDHDDLAKLVDCMTGPMWVERTNPGPEDSLCECRFLDINHDGSVDLRDYAIFQQNFGG
jgi:hypothetical protein